MMVLYTKNGDEQITRIQQDSEYRNLTRGVLRSLDLLMEEDLLTYIKLVNYCHDPYNPKNRLDDEAAFELTKRDLMLAGWVVPSAVRAVIKATTSVF